ncbi:unnamed protein product [Musa banksii]
MASTGRTDKRQVADLHKDKISEIYPSPSPFLVCKSKLLADDSESLVPEPYIVFPGRFIYTQRLKGANVDDKVTDYSKQSTIWLALEQKAYENQLLMTHYGLNPLWAASPVSNAAVHAVGLDRKVIVFKYKKKKKNHRRTIDHRQIPHCTKITRITITGITRHQDFPAETMPETSPAPCMASSGEFGLTVTCSLRNPR